MRNALDILPVETWSKIFGIVRAQSRIGDYLQLLSVSKAWGSIAEPHLYHHITLSSRDPRPSLQILSRILVATHPTHPRNSWIKGISVEVDRRLDPLGPVPNINISDWMTTLFACSRLENLTCGYGTYVNEGPMACLLDRSRDTLRHLSLNVSSMNVHSINLIHRFAELRYLSFSFNFCGRDVLDLLPDFTGISPLMLPNVALFEWDWISISLVSTHPHQDDLVRRAHRYLGTCQFNDSCNFNIIMYGKETDYVVELDPLFVKHCSALIRIEGDINFPPNSAIFRQAREVHFDDCLPPPQVFDTPRLPDRIVLNLENEYIWEPEKLYDVLDVLVESKHLHKTCLQICALLEPVSGKIEFQWDWAPRDMRMGPEYIEMCMRLAQYARLLAPKGITIADKNMKTWTFGDAFMS